jgi:hypothetical protein
MNSSSRTLIPIVVIVAFLIVIAHVLFFAAFPMAGVGNALAAVSGAAGLSIGLALAFAHEVKPGH